MWEEYRDEIGLVVVLVGLVVGAFGIGATISSTQCERQWKDSGMKSSWGLIEGCMVQRKDGTWIPADAYRQIAN